jgi:bacterioferritin-associated ferredoxin
VYICICNAIREKELREAARSNDQTVEALYAAFGKEPQCRQCLEEAEHIVDEERAACTGRELALA